MLAVLGALVPIFLLILLGWGLRARQVLDDAFWVPAERLTYYILFPALLLSNLAEAKLGGLPVAGMAAAQGVAILAMAALAAAFAAPARRPPFLLDGAGLSSVFQGLIRPNTYVGLAAAAGLFGRQGMTLVAICIALVVPLVNLLSVLALVHWTAAAGAGWRRRVVPVLTNPIILGCLAGVALNATGIGLPPLVGPFLKVLGQASLALGLLAVGAGLDLHGVRRAGAAVAVIAVGKLVLLPALVGGMACLLGLRGLPLAVTMTYASLPVAPNAYVLARQMGGDSRLAAAAITVSTLLAALTMPLWISLAG